MEEKKNNKKEVEELNNKMKNQVSGGSIDFNEDTQLYDVYDDETDKLVHSYKKFEDAVKKDYQVNQTSYRSEN